MYLSYSFIYTLNSFWYNYDTGVLTASFIQESSLKIDVRVFRKINMHPKMFEFIDCIKRACDKRGVEADDEELRVIINDEYHTIKNDAEEEILEYQYYHAGIKTGHAVRDFAFKSLPKLNLIPLPDHIGGSRKLDIFPYNFGCRATDENWLGMPKREEKWGNYIWIKETGIEKMERDDLRAHLKARDEPYAKGELSQAELINRLQMSWQKEKDSRKVHWFCCCNDDCRNKNFHITYDPDHHHNELIKIGDSLINSWDGATGRKPVFIDLVYAHLREKHWSLVINRGYGDDVHPYPPKSHVRFPKMKGLPEKKLQINAPPQHFNVPGELFVEYIPSDEKLSSLVIPEGCLQLLEAEMYWDEDGNICYLEPEDLIEDEEGEEDEEKDEKNEVKEDGKEDSKIEEKTEEKKKKGWFG